MTLESDKACIVRNEIKTAREKWDRHSIGLLALVDGGLSLVVRSLGLNETKLDHRRGISQNRFDDGRWIIPQACDRLTAKIEAARPLLWKILGCAENLLW